MKILFLIDSLIAGGKERQLHEIVKGLINSNEFRPEEIGVLTFKKSDEFANVFRCLGINMYSLENVSSNPVIRFYNLYKVIRSFKPLILHSFSVMATTYILPFRFLYNLKIIDGTIRSAPTPDSIPFKLKFLNKINYSVSQIVIANSNAGVRSFNPPLRKTNVIVNGFSEDRFVVERSISDIRNELGIKTSNVVGMVGSFTEKKDYKTYVQSAQIIQEKDPTITFLAVGDGFLLNTIKKYTKEEEINNVVYTGKREDISNLINCFDIGVLSTYTEGISNSLMEYMALKKPLIVSGEGGSDEIVTEGKNGFIIPAQNPVLLAEKILYLINNKELSKRIGENGYKTIKTKFSIKKMIDSYLNRYNHING